MKFTLHTVISIQAAGINQEQLQGQYSKRIKAVFIYTYTHTELNYAKPLSPAGTSLRGASKSWDKMAEMATQACCMISTLIINLLNVSS